MPLSRATPQPIGMTNHSFIPIQRITQGSLHSVEVVVYQYDKPFGYGCWMTSITTMNHIFIFLGYSEFPRWLPWQPPGKFRVPQKYKNVVHGCDTSHPTTISKRFIILIYHYLHAVRGRSPADDNPGGGGPGRGAGGGGPGRGDPDRGDPGGGDPGGDPGNGPNGGDEPPDDDPGDNPGPHGNGGDTPPSRRTATPAGYDWEQLNASGWGAEAPRSRSRTPGEGLSETSHNAFRERIHEAIKDAAND